jgi:hypothetical protein
VPAPLEHGLIARSHNLLGAFEAAFAQTSQCLQRTPQLVPCHINHIVAASGLGRADEVAASAARFREIAPNFSVSQWAGIIRYADPEDARALSEPLLAAGLNP